MSLATRLGGKFVDVNLTMIDITTPKAIRGWFTEPNGGTAWTWLPRSLIVDGAKYRTGTVPVTIHIPRWLAVERNLPHDEHVIAQPVDCDEALTNMPKTLEELVAALPVAPPEPAKPSRLASETGPGIAKLPMRPRPDRSVWVLDEDLLCEEVP